ncbi:MFS transporter [Streptomyces kronopolitis]|uniref:MFS transporter n=1 Tax=Streptomyces kronopolitis TaxID=1612435 RepID=UPI0036B88F37
MDQPSLPAAEEPSTDPEGQSERHQVVMTDERAVRRAVKAAAFGNAMEWFDFCIYSYMAATLGHVFFPSSNQTVQLLASFATFAVAFIVRPFGAVVFGTMGDRIGRKKVLAVTILLMAFSTFAIGLLPPYAAIGFWAPVLLIFFRLVQGFSTGGEYCGAATFIAEYAPDRRRGHYCSFLELGTLVGYVCGAGVVTALTAVVGTAGMGDWGWRIPFLVAGPLGLVGLYLRLRLEETPAFLKLEADSRRAANGTHAERVSATSGFAHIFRHHLPTVVLCIGLVAAYNIVHYMLLSYMPTYLSSELGYSKTYGLVILIVVMICLMLVINPVGRLSDRVGRRSVLMTGMVGFFFLSLPSFLLIGQGGFLAITGGLLLGLSLACLLGTMPAALPALFPTQVRYGGLAISYNISASLFAGSTPLVATALIGATGNTLVPAYYAMTAALVGMVAVLCMKETARQPLDGSPPAVTSGDGERVPASTSSRRT